MTRGGLFAIVLAVLSSPATAAKLTAEDCDAVTIWNDGAPVGLVCRGEAAEHGLTVLDLGDDWTPPALAPDARGEAPGYRASYLALAHERFDGAPGETLAPADRYFELYGIAPALDVIRRRLGDEARHRCHAAVDDAPLAAALPPIAEEPGPAALARIASARALRDELERERRRRQLADLDQLAGTSAPLRAAVERLAAADLRAAAIRAVQAHLACDGLIAAPAVAGGYTWQTRAAVEAFQRGAMILPTGMLDADTLAALRDDSRERDFVAALRVLRDRVIVATGLIEDGSAGPGAGSVLGRALEPEANWRVRGHAALDGAAGDLVAEATAAAADALGWRDAASSLAFLEALRDRPGPARFAVALPPPPHYHAAAMALSIEIDRGDVFRDPAPRPRDPERRPALILYATDAGRRIPLVRWPTTIGGWQDEDVAGAIAKRWKESPVGPRLWRELYVGPRWLPPRTTPDRELVRVRAGRFELAREAFGPSYRSAFGLIAFLHHSAELGAGFDDEGIRTHGTGNPVSLLYGTSHGCHRLLGSHAVRLAGFVLAHRDHIRTGDQPTYYRRVVRHGGSFPVAIDSLGYRIELVPPIPVEVLPGRIHAR